MHRHSPYNYAYNNPIFFIDPDGMAPMGSLASYGFKDFSDSFAEVEKREESESESESSESSETSNNAASYSNHFGSVAESAAEEDVSLDGGGECPPNCGDENNSNLAILELDTDFKVIGGAGGLEYISGGGIMVPGILGMPTYLPLRK